MKIDIVSIFVEYFQPLHLSLTGRAIENGIVDLRVHDLRTWTSDRHRTVDDSPYGGGAGMVMRPEPWGLALDALAVGQDDPRLLVMSPSGRTFDQALAHELAGERQLIFACGRYEGIDARVVEDAARRMRVDEVSIGDYVLSGGEVAAMVRDRSRGSAAAGSDRQSRIVGRGVARHRERGAARGSGLYQAPHLARAGRTRGFAERAPREDRRVASRTSIRTHPTTTARSAATV